MGRRRATRVDVSYKTTVVSSRDSSWNDASMPNATSRGEWIAQPMLVPVNSPLCPRNWPAISPVAAAAAPRPAEYRDISSDNGDRKAPKAPRKGEGWPCGKYALERRAVGIRDKSVRYLLASANAVIKAILVSSLIAITLCYVASFRYAILWRLFVLWQKFFYLLLEYCLLCEIFASVQRVFIFSCSSVCC